MCEYTPKNCKSITIKYSIASLGSPATFDDPPEDPAIDLESIEINGVPAPSDLEDLLFELCGDEWESDIIEDLPNLAKDLADEMGEYLYEQEKDRKLEDKYNGK